jgi:hypothetical protein
VRGAELLSWLASLPPDCRDAAVEAFLGIQGGAASSPPGDHLIGYHASGVAPIVRALLEVPVVPDDVLVDLGAGLGKVVLLTRLLTGATARGIELEPTLVDRARRAAARLRIDVGFERADARDSAIEDGTVFFLYAPFTGPVLLEVSRLLYAVAQRHAIVVCALGIDIDPGERWLVARRLDSFWLTIYDSVVPGVAARAPRAAVLPRPEARVIAFERSLASESTW